MRTQWKIFYSGNYLHSAHNPMAKCTSNVGPPLLPEAQLGRHINMPCWVQKLELGLYFWCNCILVQSQCRVKAQAPWPKSETLAIELGIINAKLLGNWAKRELDDQTEHHDTNKNCKTSPYAIPSPMPPCMGHARCLTDLNG